MAPQKKPTKKKPRAKRTTKKAVEEKPSFKVSLFGPASEEAFAWHFQVVVAVVLVVMVFTCGIMFEFAPDWHQGEGVAESTEYGSAKFSFYLGVAGPAGILVIGVLGKNLRDHRSACIDTVYRFQGWIGLLAVSITCFLIVYFMRDVLVFADYQMPDDGALRPYSQMYPWDMKLVPRVQDVCTIAAAALTFSLGICVFPYSKSID